MLKIREKENRIEEDHAVIILASGEECLVDKDMYPELSKHKWYCDKGYIKMASYYKSKYGSNYIHRLVLKFKGIDINNLDVDHINHNPLDNRAVNLRVCTKSQNRMNIEKGSNNTSGYKGVSFYKNSNTYMAQIVKNKKHKTIGYYFSPEDAARAYDKMAKELFGEFANLNFPNDFNADHDPPKKKRKISKSGERCINITYDNKFNVIISKNGIVKYYGRYDSLEEAKNVRDKIKETLYAKY